MHFDIDMYAYVTEQKLPRPVDFANENLEPRQFFYWQNHRQLHFWFESIYHAKGGISNEFKFNKVEVSLSDLLDLERMMKKPFKTEIITFFSLFGFCKRDQVKRDLEFIALARNYISEGKTIYYQSFYKPWW